MFRIGTKIVIEEKLTQSVVSKGSIGIVAYRNLRRVDLSILHDVVFIRFGKNGKLRFLVKTIYTSPFTNEYGISHVARKCEFINLLDCSWEEYFAFNLALLYGLDKYTQLNDYDLINLGNAQDNDYSIVDILQNSKGRLFRYIFDNYFITLESMHLVHKLIGNICLRPYPAVIEYCAAHFSGNVIGKARQEELLYIAKIKSLLRYIENKDISTYINMVQDAQQHRRLITEDQAKMLIRSVNDGV